MRALGVVTKAASLLILLASCQSTAVRIDGKNYTNFDDALTVMQAKMDEAVAKTQPVETPIGGRVKLAVYSADGLVDETARRSERQGVNYDRSNVELIRFHRSMAEKSADAQKRMLEASAMFDEVYLDLSNDPRNASLDEFDYLLAYDGYQGILQRWRIERADPPRRRIAEVEFVADLNQKNRSVENRLSWVKQIYVALKDLDKN